MTKIFPKSRVCVIDVYPSFETGLKKAIEFSNKHNISINSPDGHKIILVYCLKHIQETYDSTKSQYPKVLCISKKSITKRIENFVNNHLNKMMEQLSLPYCGKHEITSPDLEFAAQNSLRQQKTKKRQEKFVSTLKLK